jgi:hypothetical protein
MIRLNEGGLVSEMGAKMPVAVVDAKAKKRGEDKAIRQALILFNPLLVVGTDTRCDTSVVHVW